LQIPTTMMVHSQYFERNYPSELLSVIPAMADNGVVLLNPHADFWKDPLQESRKAFAVHYWSTPSPLHVFFHEYAHLHQTEETRNQLLTPRQRTLAASVSIRAELNVDEFLSEVYAGLAEGVQYDSDILRAYKRLGGKIP